LPLNRSLKSSGPPDHTKIDFPIGGTSREVLAFPEFQPHQEVLAPQDFLALQEFFSHEKVLILQEWVFLPK